MLYRLKILAALVFVCTTGKIGFAQTLDLQKKNIPFKVFKTTEDTISISKIASNKDYIEFASPSNFKKTTPKDIYWFQIDLPEAMKNATAESRWYLNIGSFNTATFYYRENDSIKSKKTGYFEVSDSRKNNIPFRPDQLFDGGLLYFKVQRLTNKYAINKDRVYLFDETSNHYHQKYYPSEHMDPLITNYIFVGISCIIFLISIILFFINKKLEYLFYALNIFCITVYFSRYYSDLYVHLFGYRTLTSYYITIQLEVLIYVFYYQFAVYYLNAKENYPKFYKAIKWITVFLICVTVPKFIFLSQNNFTANLILLDIRTMVLTLFGLMTLVYLIVFRKNKLTYFFIIGSAFYFLGGLLFFLFFKGIFLLYGVIAEIIVFGLGLGYKIKLEQDEKFRLQEESINNHIKALRAQMNPHFIFNSLNSIQHLVLKKDTAAALNYLTKFSRLIRSTLENSIEKNVVLEEEIKILKTYLELESLRFNNDFTYQIIVDEPINPLEVEIPLLLIQPFVENAIIHGLHHKKGDDKKLVIHFSEEKKYIICTIEDNGIGRKAVAAMQNLQYKKKNKSLAITLTETRIQMLHKNDMEKSAITFEDLYDPDGIAAGTRVTVKIPKN